MEHVVAYSNVGLRIEARSPRELRPLPTADAPIGVFDSGLGGLTVLKALQKRLPAERFWFVADQHHVPYGERSLQQITTLAESLGHSLLNAGCKLVTPACNVSCATALENGQLPQDRCIGVIEPAVQTALEQSEAVSLGLIATSATVRSQAYAAVLSRHDSGKTIKAVAAPKWVPLVEAGNLDGPEAVNAVQETLQQFEGSDVDTIILGCTHYPWLLPVLQRLAPQYRFIDPADATAEAVAQWLKASRLESTSDSQAELRCLTTGDPAVFAQQLKDHAVEALPEEAAWAFAP